jgi:type I restriction enzyme, S subunit
MISRGDRRELDMGEGMSEWNLVTLGKIAEKIGSGATPRGGSNVYKDAGISLIRSQNILDFKFSNDGLVYIDDDQADELKNVTVQDNDVLLNITGDSVARCCVVPSSVLPARVNQHVSIIRLNTKKASYSFIFYLLQCMKEELLMQSEIGATRRALTKGMIENLEIPLPPLPEQKAIASILSSLDDKIDLLHRQNRTLEAISETLFRQWFIEEAQEDWEEISIVKLFEVRDGTHDSPKQTSIGKYLITSKHILDGQIDIDNAYLISEDDFNKVNQRSKVDTGDILFSMIGTIGLIYLEQSSDIDYAIKNIGLFKTSQNLDWAIYTYLWLKSPTGRQFIDEHKSGSTQEYVALGSLRSIAFKSPPLKALKEFNKFASEYFSKMSSNRTQIRTLEKLRDNLLPKLMSGEVRVET